MTDRSEDSNSGRWCILTSPNTNPYLPPEVWAKIFRYLPMSDKLSVANTCPEWDELLTSEKHIALLEKVLPLLNLNQQTILTLREVSKEAKQSVDNILATFANQQESFYFNHEVSTRRRNFNIIIDQLNSAYNFSSFFLDDELRRSALRFLTEVGENRGREDNPFLTRSAEISFTDSERDFATTERMLTLFGHHLWSLTVNIHANLEEQNIENQRHLNVPTGKLPRLLRLVPNLKHLNLAATSARNAVLEQLGPEELPNLEHLGSLSFGDWYNLPTLPLVDMLSVEILNAVLPNLKILNIWYSPRYITLQKLANVNWQLEELRLESLHHVNNWRYLFNAIGNFSQTLILLKLGSGLQSLRLPTSGWEEFLNIFIPLVPVMPHLQVLGLDSTFMQNSKCYWFFESVSKRWGNVRELHVDTALAHEVVILNWRLVYWAFRTLPNLGTILNWSNNPQNFQLTLDYVLTRPDAL
ncbi:hypothetical protein Ocin01_13841 [Orchesella cincta]|uniref:F-box domain-containing protein n=1 Tax=Orchesella cincta TaxID=48709 RepID=A0A1D2MIN4_ORCCI|nr:hypothetical protein Ocin01_13841 [Orchesella cincta]